MESQHCHLACLIVSLLSGACTVYGYEDTCKFFDNHKCTQNVTKRYGFNIYNPDIMDQVPILNNTEFIELCSDYISMVNCLKANKPCDLRSRRYTEYALALANALDYACKEDVLDDYEAVESCFQGIEVQKACKSCHKILRQEIQALVNQTVEAALVSRIDMTVVVEKACHHLISSMDCTTEELLRWCSPFVNDWYRNVFISMIQPTLKDYRCELYMPVSKIVNLFFVSLAAAIVLGVAVYVCIQRYKSFMRGRMNFVLSVIPKAQHTLRKFDPRISQSTKTSKTATTEPTDAPPATSAVSQPPPTDPATAHVLQELSKTEAQSKEPQSKERTTSWWGWSN